MENVGPMLPNTRVLHTRCRYVARSGTLLAVR